MKRYRLKPIEVEAVRVGSVPYERLAKWINAPSCPIKDGNRIVGVTFRNPHVYMNAAEGTWLVRDVATGEIAVLSHEIFTGQFREVREVTEEDSHG